eukprot:COSAG01_NODE_22032_length_875_cov_0.612113_1_plen_175_part_10
MEQPGSSQHSSTAAALITTDTVATLLRDAGTRSDTLDTLEVHGTLIERALSLAVAPTLVDLLTANACEVDQEQFDRIGLLLERLLAEAQDDPAVYGAAFGGGRTAALWGSEYNVAARALRKPAEELTAADARSIVFIETYKGACMMRGATKPLLAAGFPGADWFTLFMQEHPLVS